MIEYRAIVIDECGDEWVADTYRIGEDLDEDYMEIWKSTKVEKVREESPECRGVYLECVSDIRRQAMIAARDDMYYDPWEDEDYEEEDDYGEGDYSGNMPCDTYGPLACSSSCPQYYQCQA